MKNLSILNPADKTRMYTVAVGEGAPASGDALVKEVHKFPLGSQYTDVENKKFYVRFAVKGLVADWGVVGGGSATPSTPEQGS